MINIAMIKWMRFSRSKGQDCIFIKYENIFLNGFLLYCVDSIVKELQEHHEQQTNERKKFVQAPKEVL